MIGEDKLIHFSGVEMGAACTIVLRGASKPNLLCPILLCFEKHWPCIYLPNQLMKLVSNLIFLFILQVKVQIILQLVCRIAITSMWDLHSQVWWFVKRHWGLHQANYSFYWNAERTRRRQKEQAIASWVMLSFNYETLINGVPRFLEKVPWPNSLLWNLDPTKHYTIMLHHGAKPVSIFYTIVLFFGLPMSLFFNCCPCQLMRSFSLPRKEQIRMQQLVWVWALCQELYSHFLLQQYYATSQCLPALYWVKTPTLIWSCCICFDSASQDSHVLNKLERAFLLIWFL